MCVIRVEKTRNYSIVSKDILWDKRLTPKARFMLIFMLSLADSWEYSVRGLSKAIGCGVEATVSGLKELEEYGYLVREQNRGEQGRFASANYILFENPDMNTPHTENQSTENSPQYINNISNNKESIIDEAETPSKKSKKGKQTCKPPTLEEVIQYAKTRNSPVDPKFFFDYYDADHWSTVVNWKQKFVTWDNKEKLKRNISTTNKQLEDYCQQSGVDLNVGIIEDDFFK